MNLHSSDNRVVRFTIAVGFLLATAYSLLADPRSPLPPWPEANPIARLTWDAVMPPMWDDSAQAVGQNEATLVEGWSGHALQREGALVAPFVLPGLNPQGVANLGYRQGCLRFWFAPSWTSGTGPGQVARLAEWIVTDGREVGTLWALSVNEDGTVISLGSQGADVLKAEINWSAGTWHQVALNYNERGTELVVNGVLVATGAGLLAVEPKISGLVMGSDWQGLLVAGGQFDECLLFAEPMSAEDVAFNYRGCAFTTTLGPMSAEEAAEFNAPMMAGLDGGGSFARLMFDESNPCPTNGPLFMTNLWCERATNGSRTMSFDVAGGELGVAYDVFGSVDLTSATATNGAWDWVTNAYQCSTVMLTNQPEFMKFYILGTPQDDDSDGLTTAFERLVSATDPFDADSDNDSIPDGWEWNHGFDPHDPADAADDPDGDWLTNYQEYNGGTNSTNPHDVMVLAWGQDHGGQLLVPENLRNVTMVTGGWDYSLALRLDGTVASWGYSTNILGSVTNGIRLSSGAYHALALQADGTLAIWGDWWPSAGIYWPANIPSGLTNVVAISSGADHDLALRADGTVVAWGYYYNAPYTELPTNLPSAKGVAAGWEHSAVLLTDGTVRAFGPNLFGMTNVPAGLNEATAIAAGAYHTLALRSDGTVVA